MQQTVYGPLQKSVSLLVVDDDTRTLGFYQDLFEEHPLYSVTCVSTSREAQKILQSSLPVHLGILDMGIRDIDNDEFFLLRTYAKKLPFIVISGTSDIERAYEASSLGAKGIFGKPLDLMSDRFWKTLRTLFLNKLILPGETSDPLLDQCCMVLKDTCPETVAAWADASGLSVGYLRKVCMKGFGIAPKQILFLYRLYRDAFLYYENKRNTKIDSRYYDRQIGYYLQNKKLLDTIRDTMDTKGKLPVIDAMVFD